jgi:hypothetical protein
MPMKHHAAWILGLCCTLGALAQQSPNDIEVLKKYAGTWAADCSKPGVRLGVDVKALTISSGGKQVGSTAPPMSAFSWFGKQQPPAGFEVALLGEGLGISLVFMAMKDASGPYLKVEPDAPLDKQFGKAALAGKFRRCP